METSLFSLTLAGFIFLSVIMYALVLRELKKAIALTPWTDTQKRKIFNKVLFAILGWTLLICMLGLSGFLQDFNAVPPRLMIVLIVPLITIIAVTFSKTTKELLQHLPMKHIVRLQVFRVFVEILLWTGFLVDLIPVQMTFEGRNFDVLAGLTAPIVAYFLVNSKVALVIWNILSLGLLINIITIAILSMPTPFRVFMNDPANTFVTGFPGVLLPGLLVPLAYGLHFLSLRKLALK